MVYTYAHFKNSDNKCFYIGMGIGKRAYSKQRHKEWKEIAIKEPYTVKILANWNTREEAISHERLLISCFKELGHPLTNKNNGGGGGFLGLSHSNETKQKVSNSLKNRNPESTKRCIEAFHSVESRKKAAIANKGKKKPEEIAEKLRNLRVGSRHSEETKLRISNSMKKRFNSV